MTGGPHLLGLFLFINGCSNHFTRSSALDTADDREALAIKSEVSSTYFELLTEAAKVASSANEEYLVAGLMRKIAEQLALNEESPGAIRIIEQIGYRYTRMLSYADVAQAQGRAGDIRGARKTILAGIRLCHEDVGDFKTGDAYAHLIVALARIGDIEKAMACLADIPEGFIREFATEELALVLALHGEIDQATKLLSRLESKDSSIRNIALKVLEGNGPARALLLANRISDPEQRNLTITSVAVTCLKQGLNAEGVQIAKSITDSFARSEALISLAEVVAEKDAKEAYALILQAEDDYKVVLDSSDCARILTKSAWVWARIGKSEMAIQRAAEAERMCSAIPDEYVRTYRIQCVAEIYATAGNAKKARELAPKELARGRDQHLGRVAVAQVEAGDLKGALETVEGCKNHAFLAQVLLTNALRQKKKYEARGYLQRALEAMEEVNTTGSASSPNPFAEILDHIVEAQTRIEDYAGALLTALRIRREHGAFAWGSTLSLIAEAEATAGLLQNALVWINKVDEPLAKALALIGAAEGLVAKRAAATR
jgi:tetratricopeptide (TPR) repeat protein